MRRTDDSSLTPEQWTTVRRAAERALGQGGGFGRYPTPIHDIMAAARVTLAPSEALTEGFLTGLRRRITTNFKHAIKKVLGVLDAIARLVYVDCSLLKVKQNFIKLHETAHAVIPHQKGIYAVLEDCEKTLDPEIAELFEREANVFASEVLFQMDGFISEARDQTFGIKAPLGLNRRYGASCYAAIRQYVSKNDRACVVLVLDPLELVDGTGVRANLRRLASSPSFSQMFGKLRWPEYFTSGDEIGNLIPHGKRRMSGRQTISLRDDNGDRHECLAEAFKNSYNTFILIWPLTSLARRSRFVLPAGIPVKAS